VVLYFLSMPLLGLLILQLVSPGRRWPAGEAMGLSLVLGMGAVAMLMFGLSLAGCRTATFFPGLLCAMSALGLLMVRPRVEFAPPARRDVFVQTIPAVLTILAVCTAVALSQKGGFDRGDAFCIWALKGRALALDPLSHSPAVFHASDYQESHPNYPLLVPFLIAGAYQACGSFNDAVAKLIFPLMLASTALTAWFGLRRVTSARIAAGCTATWVVTPAMVVWSSIGYADTALAMFVFAAGLHFVVYVRDQQPAHARIACLCCAFAAFTKNEGLTVATILLMVVLFLALRSPRQLAHLLIGAAIALVMVMPWLILRGNLTASDENYPARLSLVTIWQNIGRMGVIVPALFRESMSLAVWGIFWPAVPIALVMHPRRLVQRPGLLVGLAMLMQLATYVIVYLITPWNITELLNVTVQRLLIHVSPLALLLIALLAGKSPCHGRHPESTTVA
jgi:hypothetical protein